MPVARIALAITLSVNDACDTITLVDSTGQYPTVEAGYGRPTGATSNSVTTCTIVVTLPSGDYFTYVFTISSGSITAATLALNTATPTTITSYFGAVVFPFTGLDLFGDYGVTLPEVTDGVYTVSYKVQGRIDPVAPDTAYNYTTSKSTGIFCDLCCCLSKKALAIDPDCEDCFDEKMMSYMRAATYGKVAKFALQVGKVADATKAFDKAVTLCDEECGC